MAGGSRGRMEVFQFGEGSCNTWHVSKAPEFTPNTPEPWSLSVSPSNPPALGSLWEISISWGSPWAKKKAKSNSGSTSHADHNHHAPTQLKPLRITRQAQQLPASPAFTLPAFSHRVLLGTSWPLSVTKTSEWSSHLPACFRIHDIPNDLSHGSSACSWLPFKWWMLDEHLP